MLAWKGPVSVRDGYKHREERQTRVILAGLEYHIVLRIDRRIAEYTSAALPHFVSAYERRTGSKARLA
ncbi:MAG: hypothetical protein Q8Q14_07870 [Gemmatimonadales bacterium]|nr:hypothetical protein [Gemmatimonadales bacterium]